MSIINRIAIKREGHRRYEEETSIAKRGRPVKKGGTPDERKLRKQWREASAEYYKKNKKRILKKAKKHGGKKRK